MISRYASFVRRNPITPISTVIMGLVLVTELYTIAFSESMFEYLFLAQNALTPGLLLAPFSHGTFYTHYVPNMGLLLLMGWPLEDRLSEHQFLTFMAVTAYLPTYLQVIYSSITTGTAGSLGFSGVVYGMPPLLFCLVSQEDHMEEVGFGEIGNIAFGFTVAIPLIIAGVLDFFSILPSAKITHSTGYMISRSH